VSIEDVPPKSRPSLLVLIARGAGFLIMLGSCPFIFLAMFARMDHADELPGLRSIDAIIGLALAIGYVLWRIPLQSAEEDRRRGAISVAVKAMVLWLLVSGGLMSCHHHQIWVRDRAAERWGAEPTADDIRGDR
jgi:hypothetical protein